MLIARSVLRRCWPGRHPVIVRPLPARQKMAPHPCPAALLPLEQAKPFVPELWTVEFDLTVVHYQVCSILAPGKTPAEQAGHRRVCHQQEVYRMPAEQAAYRPVCYLFALRW